LFLLTVPSWIFSSLAVLCLAVSQIATWILVQNVGRWFYYPRQFVTVFPYFLYYIGVTGQWQVCTLPLSVPLSIHGAQCAQASEYPPFSITACTVG
jgi:hypothetical protein